MDYFTRLRGKLEEELSERIIPFWMEHSIDEEYGGFLSCLERDGAVYDTLKQMWMQWREVYMFAALYNNRRFRKEEYLAIAEKGFDFLMRYGRKNDGTYHYMLDRQGRSIAETADGAEIFSESFAAIACAELFKATGKRKYEEEAFSCLKVYQEHTKVNTAVKDGAAVWHHLAWPMIELNVLQIMHNAFGEKIPDCLIEGCIAEILSFRNPADGLFRENRLADGSFDSTSQAGRLSNPGHTLEGLGFIMAELQLRKEENPVFYRKYIDIVLDSVEQTDDFGWDKEQGGIFYYRDTAGKPLVKNECMLKAWWPQNESATAMLRAYGLSGKESFLDRFESINAFAWMYLRDPDYPEWFAYAAVEGRLVHSYKGSRWKTFFHVPRYLVNCIEVCADLENPGRRECEQ